MVYLNQNIKTIGLIPVVIILHPEVKVEITLNIARSPEEAEIQAKTGRALIAEAQEEEPAPVEEPEEIQETAEASEESVQEENAEEKDAAE